MSLPFLWIRIAWTGRVDVLVVRLSFPRVPLSARLFSRLALVFDTLEFLFPCSLFRGLPFLDVVQGFIFSLLGVFARCTPLVNPPPARPSLIEGLCP